METLKLSVSPALVCCIAPCLTCPEYSNSVLPVKTLTFKVADDEARVIRSLAANSNLNVSEFRQRRASETGAALAKPGRAQCRQTGAVVFSPLPENPPLTTEDVREMLAEFP